MEQRITGEIISDEGHSLLIAIEDDEQCHSCGLKGSCSNKTLRVAKSQVCPSAKSGDKVAVEYHKLLQASALLYLLPLLLFFAGMGLSASIIKPLNELYVFFSGIASLTAAFFLVRMLTKKLSKEEYKILITVLTQKD